MPAVNPYELMIVKQQAMIALANVGVAVAQATSPVQLNSLRGIADELTKIINQPE